MTHQFSALIVILPLVVSFFVFLSNWWLKKTGYLLALTALFCCLLLSIGILDLVIASGVIHYRLGGWLPPWGIEYYVDTLNAIMLVLVSFLSFLTAVFARKSVEIEIPEKGALFWALYLLLMTGLLGIIVTGDLFNLFVLLEVASLSGYVLIAVGEKRSLFASFRYVVIGTMGASFYLLGVGYLYITTGSLNMVDLSLLLPKLYTSKVVLAGFIFILIGLGIKTALFPLHGWLPDAYTYAPTAVSAAVAPLMTKVMAYAILRIMFTVFKAEFPVTVIEVTDVMVWTGTLAMLVGGVMALSQSDFKRMLAYVIVAEIGYIIGGIGVANATALKGAVFHIINDAVMMACLFMVAGLIVYKTKGHRIDNFIGFFRVMPVTAVVFTVGALAVIGVPPTCGFFSKWYLLLGGIEDHQWFFVAALLICTLINVALFFRIFDKGIYLHAHGQNLDAGVAAIDTPGNDAPISMWLPALVLALVILLIGVFNQVIVETVIRHAVPAGI
ncbi:MAG: proton-conducting transporter membrane subunit [Desulfobacterales bacterium]|nr:proton-conducting transporter membrane subunit [Desulfobacterales bacterium]